MTMTPTLLTAAMPSIAAKAQEVYDLWEQDVDGMDDEYGAGGICHDIASAIVGELGELGVENALTVHSAVGENHVFVVALVEDGVYEIDIPPQVYESGGGYVWRKIPGVVFDETSVVIGKIAGPMSRDEFEETYGDG
jgi:hypothetical protein